MAGYKHLPVWEYAYELQMQMLGPDFDMAAVAWCDDLAANLLGALPPDHRHLLYDVPIIVLPTKNPNAMIIQAPKGGYIIALDSGLISLLTTLNKIVLCRLSLFGLEPNLSDGDAYKMAKNSIRFFLGQVESLPRWPAPPKKMLISSALGNIQISFIIGHELGHMVLGHLGASEPLSTKRIIQDVKPDDPLYVTHAYKAFRFKDAPEQEIEADRRAAELVINHFQRTYDPLFGDSEKAYALAGIDILFTYFEYLRIVADLPSESPTHPPANQRKKFLRKYMWGTTPDTGRKLATAFEDIIENFQQRIIHERQA